MVLAARTGLEWGKPPGFMLGGPDTWTDRDRVVALGWRLAQDQRCTECGHPLAVCRDPGMAGRFDVQADICQAQAALERHRDQPGDPPPGELLYVTPEAPAETAEGYGGPPEGWVF